MSPEFVEQQLKRYWKIDELLLVAEYRRRNPKFGEFLNFSAPAYDRTVIYPHTEGEKYNKSIIIKVDHQGSLEHGSFYLVRVKPAVNQSTNNPYEVELEEICEKLESHDSPREFIKKWFVEKGENPGDAATIASQLRLNELELYTQTERFIFELIQNADDMPTEGKKVSVTMELLEDYFLFVHNGKFFDRFDVQAIADAAQSTKSRDKTKTGYKGIGFKSVFTDSSRVYIKSGDYSFKFDKLNPVYQNFWTLYEGYINKLSSQAQIEFKQKYKGKEEQYVQIERIPWQIKPIWIERSEFPGELRKSSFGPNHNVAIALEIGRDIFKEKGYSQKIKNLLSEPRFLLFLRNITALQYVNGSEESTLSLTLQHRDNQADILFDNNLHSTYTTWENEITISNESFTEVGLHFQKREVQEGKYEFVDSEGQKIKNIPEKLSFLDRTVLTFAAQTEGTEIKALPKQDAILFNYLPTSDKRFEFPFLVNGDFITKTDREFILHENVWNQYLFYHIGYAHIEWLSQLAKKRTYQSSYLRLLVNKLKDENHSSEGLINASFNRGIIKAIAELPFLLTVSGDTVPCQDIILDETGISTIFGESFFYAFTSISKKLPNPKIQFSILRRDFLGIDQFKVKDLLNRFAQNDSLVLFTEAVRGLGKEDYLSFLDWLNKLCKDNQDAIGPVINGLPFIRLGNQVMSWSAIAQLDTYLLLDERTGKLREIIAALGIISSEVSIDKTSTLKQALKATNTYLGTDLLLYSRLSTKCHNCTLTAQQKAKLMTFFATLTQVGEDKYARTLCLYTDESGIRRPLEKLINRNLADVPNWFSKYRINEVEAALLPSFASKYLIQESNLFSRLYCDPGILGESTKELDERNAAEWASQLLVWRGKDFVDYNSAWNNLSWLYTNDTHRFRSASELWDHPVLAEIKAHSVIENITGWILPHSESRKIANELKLSLLSYRLSESLVPSDITISQSETVLLLEFLIKAKENDFLNKFQIVSGEGGYQLKAMPASNRQYTADEDFIAYLNTRSNIISLILFPVKLSAVKGINELGVLMGKELIKWLVNTDPNLGLTPFVVKQRDSALSESFLTKLPGLELLSHGAYGQETNENTLIRLAHRIYKEKDEESEKSSRNHFVGLLRSKVLIDGSKPDNRFFYEKVVIRIDDKNKPPFGLSELLPSYADSSLLLDKLVSSFKDFNVEEQAFLRKTLFSSTPKMLSDIESEIRELKEPYLSPLRTVFLIMCKKCDPAQFKDPLAYFRNRVFDDHFNNLDDKEGLYNSYSEFLTHCYNHQFIPDDFGFYDIDFDKLVDTPEAVDAELLPDWLSEWYSGDINKRQFLHEWGINGPDSDVVKLRKSLLSNDLDTANDLITELRSSKRLLVNTMQWVYENQTPYRMVKWLPSIYNLLTYIFKESDGLKYLPVRLPKQGVDVVNELIQYDDQPLHLYHDEWAGYIADVLHHIQSEGGFLIETDMPTEVRKKLSFVDDDLTIDLPAEFENECKLFDDDLYKTWEYESDYPIYVYNHNAFPWKLWYNGEPIADANKGAVSYYEDKKTYLTKSTANDFPRCLVDTEFPADQLKLLLRLYANSSVKQEATSQLSDNSPDTHYNPILDKVKQGVELSKDEQKQWHAEAVNRGMAFLIKEGYDFSSVEEAQHPTYGEYHKLVVDPSQKIITAYYRNALGGLLYLNPGLWKKLSEGDTVLVVVYEDGEPRAFTTQEELLKEKYNKYMLYRAFNDKQPDTVNPIAEKLEDGTGHLLFVTGQNYYKHLYNILKAQPEDTPINKPLAGLENL